MVLRIVMFCVVGALIAWINQVIGTNAGALPWIFVFSGLGGVAAVDVFGWWLARSLKAQQESRDPHRNDSK